MFVIGDKVEILGPQGNIHAVKFGKVVQINTRSKTRLSISSDPATETEPLYSVRLDSGELLQYLVEQQLRKY